jgi:hypothetical protein
MSLYQITANNTLALRKMIEVIERGETIILLAFNRWTFQPFIASLYYSQSSHRDTWPLASFGWLLMENLLALLHSLHNSLAWVHKQHTYTSDEWKLSRDKNFPLDELYPYLSTTMAAFWVLDSQDTKFVHTSLRDKTHRRSARCFLMDDGIDLTPRLPRPVSLKHTNIPKFNSWFPPHNMLHIKMTLIVCYFSLFPTKMIYLIYFRIYSI